MSSKAPAVSLEELIDLIRTASSLTGPQRTSRQAKQMIKEALEKGRIVKLGELYTYNLNEDEVDKLNELYDSLEDWEIDDMVRRLGWKIVR